MMDKVLIVSYNVKGLNNPAKRKKVLTQLKGVKCDIAILNVLLYRLVKEIVFTLSTSFALCLR